MGTSRSAGDVSVRFSVQDKEAVSKALESLGKDGQTALARIAAAGEQPSRSLQAMSAVMSDVRGTALGLGGSFGIVSTGLLALGPVGIGTAAVLGGLYLAFNKVSEGAKAFGVFARDVRDNAVAVGLTATQYQGVVLQLQQFGVEQDKASSALMRFAVHREEAAQGTGALYKALKEQNAEMARQFALARTTEEAINIFAQALANATDKQRAFLANAAFGRGGAILAQGFLDLAGKGGVGAVTEALLQAGKVTDEQIINKQAEAAAKAVGRAQAVERAWNEAYAGIYAKWKEFKHDVLGVDPDNELKIAVRVKVAAESGSVLDVLKALSGTNTGKAISMSLGIPSLLSTGPVVDAASKGAHSIWDVVKIPGDAMDGRYSRSAGMYPAGSEEAEYFKRIGSQQEVGDAFRLGGYGLQARGGLAPNLIPESFPGIVGKAVQTALAGTQAPASFAERFGGFAIPAPGPQYGPTNPTASETEASRLADQKARLQLDVPAERERLGILGDTASITERVKAKEDELTLSRMNGANVSDDEAKRVIGNYRIQLTAAQLSIRERLGIADEETISKQKLIEMEEQLAKAGVVSAEQRITAEKIVRKEAIDTANAVKVRASDTPALTKLSQDGSNLAKNLDENLAGALRGIGQEFSLLNKSTDTFGQKLKNLSLRIVDAAYQAVLMKTVISPLANLISGGLGSAFGISGDVGGGGVNFAGGGGGGFPNATGNIFDRGLVRFAGGGIFDRPTMFRFENGGRFNNGLLGEAGPEAIMPLARGADGRLGVRGGGGSVVHQHFYLDGAMTHDDVKTMVMQASAAAVRESKGFTAVAFQQYERGSLPRMQQKRALEG